MALSLQQLLALSQLNKIGRSKVIALGKYTKSITCKSENELLDIFLECIDKKVVTGVDSNGYSINTIHNALNTAERILINSENERIKVISFFDELFPDKLRRIVKTRTSRSTDSPAFLYVKGNLSLFLKKGVAMIGTRKPTAEGLEAGEYFASRFARDGLNIISGLAIGCDSSAHRGALKIKGATTAILAHGLDMVYPKENSVLADQILDNDGLIVSEYPIETKPISNFFVERDRLQSGLADATVVIQMGIKGGTMHAVNSTIENEKPLYAVQYSSTYQGGALSHNEKAQGNIMLIREEKAKPLTRNTYQDVLETICESTMAIKSQQIGSVEQINFLVE